jgi:protein phosphatase
VDDPNAGNGELQGHAVLATLTWGMRSHGGPAREHNEDYVGVHASTAPDDAWDRSPLFLLADGMGGHAAGEVASRVAVETALEHWTTSTPNAGSRGLRAVARAANLAVIDAADAPGRHGMGTTFTALTLSGHEASVAHVGDSRAYLVRRDSCIQVTVDHSRAGDMLRMKLISAEQAANHPARSQLTRSLGSDPLVQIDVYRQPVLRGDTWVLCSDGLWDVVGSRDLVDVVSAIGIDSTIGTAGDAAQRLVDLAIERRTLDNVSVVVVQVTSDRPIPPEPRRSLFRRRS